MVSISFPLALSVGFLHFLAAFSERFSQFPLGFVDGLYLVPYCLVTEPGSRQFHHPVEVRNGVYLGITGVYSRLNKVAYCTAKLCRFLRSVAVPAGRILKLSEWRSILRCCRANHQSVVRHV